MIYKIKLKDTQHTTIYTLIQNRTRDIWKKYDKRNSKTSRELRLIYIYIYIYIYSNIFSNNDRHLFTKTFSLLHYTCRHFTSSHLQLHLTTKVAQNELFACAYRFYSKSLTFLETGLVTACKMSVVAVRTRKCRQTRLTPPPLSMKFHQDPQGILELDSCCGWAGADVLGLPHVLYPSDISSLSTQKFMSGWVLLICKSVRFSTLCCLNILRIFMVTKMK